MSDSPLADAKVRPDTPGNQFQFRFARGDVVETFPSPGGRFLIHFTRDGDNAVPMGDTDATGVPDFVEQVASTYDEVLVAYTDLGFREPLGDGALPDNGGDDRFDVYLVDFGGVGDGNFQRDTCLAVNPDQCPGFMLQENDFKGYGYPSTAIANRILASHEFFHAVQAAYDVDQGSVMAEGTAVWATETFDPTLKDFEGFLPGYFQNTDRPIDEPLPGPVDPFSYGSAIFFKFLEEAHGPGVIADLWEACENGSGGLENPYWLERLDGVLINADGVTFEDAFAEFARWNLRTGAFADPACSKPCGWRGSSYARGAGYPRPTFSIAKAPVEEDALRLYRASTQYFALAPDGRSAMTAALVSDDSTELGVARLILATETGDRLETAVVKDVSAGVESLDTRSADRFLVAVISTAISGDSIKPGLCIGSPEEVETCKSSLMGEGGAGGAGGDGSGGQADDTGADEGCECQIPAAAPTSTKATGYALMFVVGLLRLARRRFAASANVANRARN